jgi:hypothetical protein
VHALAATPSHCSSYSIMPLPQVARSQASPTRSPSESVRSPFVCAMQLSRWSGTPSRSLSGLAGTMVRVAPVSHVTPGGQFAFTAQTPCSRLHAPDSQNAPAGHCASVPHAPPTDSMHLPTVW